MSEPEWLTRAEAVAIHEMTLAQHGGVAGLRDAGLLESVLSKPKNLFAQGSPTFAKLAASYGAGIIRKHPFRDGNKRTGFMLAATFLESNGLEFTATEESVIAMTLGIASGQLTEAAYAKWLEENSSEAG